MIYLTDLFLKYLPKINLILYITYFYIIFRFGFRYYDNSRLPQDFIWYR